MNNNNNNKLNQLYSRHVEIYQHNNIKSNQVHLYKL